ncbi:MAG TPA: hypothetical protein VE944_26640 [Nostoc sp.]|uniref:hypothetical protein n=1 Tax=Nostoc sp. TaxID=1180 RepID=UPI002D6EB7CB|nr:hypothetical protein [Nostoc sp.]HYX17873.1 hypothetical protein [Nostoc sp.]
MFSNNIIIEVLAVDVARKMRRELRLGKIEKSKLFTQKQAADLSGFTRAQLITWEESEIVLPKREYAILYTWNQLILLRILYYLRQRWSIHQVVEGIRNSRRSIDEILEMLPKSVVANFGKFGIHPDIEIQLHLHDFSNAKDDLEEITARKIFSREDFPLMEQKGRQTRISIPKIIQEVKAFAEEKEVKNLDLKLG